MTQSCEDYRTALSARLDGEDPGPVQLHLADHLAQCDACRAWLAAAEAMTKTIQNHDLLVPDLSATILAGVHADRVGSQRAGQARSAERRRILQVALGLSAVVQLALAVPMLFFAGAADLVHTGRENASFDIALAVGFALAAWRPERARAFVPVAFVLAGCLAVTSAFDVVAGAAVLRHEISHVAALAQAAILLALSRMSTPTVQTGARAMARTS